MNRYRPDLYPGSYCFQHESARIGVEFLRGSAHYVRVYFDKMPSEDIEVLLARYSGIEPWKPTSTREVAFASYFPLFNPEAPRNRFFTTVRHAALIQTDTAGIALGIHILTESYRELLAEYRKERKAAEPGATDNPDDAQ
jgi:hypothetical protein